MISVGINGFGRIGRAFLRGVLLDQKAREKISVVAINIGKGDVKSIAHLFKYDTLMGTFPGTVAIQGNELIINDNRIKVISELDPLKIDWASLGVTWVVESSGHFTTREGAEKHVKAGAQYVLISAPAKGDDITIIPGVNEGVFDAKKHHVISLGSCTTNALLPTLKVINDVFTIEQGMMTTIHAYTNSQVLLDIEGEDLRRSRAAALNIIPTTTGASDMVGKMIPSLAGKIEAMSIRVPIGKVSLIDLVVHCTKNLSKELLHEAFTAAQKGTMKGILDISYEPLVSSDYSGNNHSVIIDAPLSQVQGKMAKIFGWYDNEWGYSMRLKDFLVFAVSKE